MLAVGMDVCDCCGRQWQVTVMHKCAEPTRCDACGDPASTYIFKYKQAPSRMVKLCEDCSGGRRIMEICIEHAEQRQAAMRSFRRTIAALGALYASSVLTMAILMVTR